MTVPSDARITFALVIPAHNEAEHIASVLDAVPAWVDRIIVVDDASEDDTASTVSARTDARVLLVRHEANRGVGGAMKSGYRQAIAEGFDLIGKMDGDGQMVAEELARLTRPFELGLADYTKGNRFYFAGATAGMPWLRKLGNNGLSLMTKIASGYWHIYDSQCGFLVTRRSFLDKIDLDNLPDDYFFENAMLIQMNALNARVVDVPTSTVYGQEVSGVSIGRVLLSFPPRLVVGGIRRFWRRHVVTDFGAIGLSALLGFLLGAFGTLFGGYHWWLSIATDRVASTGTVMIAVLPLILGVQLIVQAWTLSVMASPGASETAVYIRELMIEGAL